jgi:hypothetical protein
MLSIWWALLLDGCATVPACARINTRSLAAQLLLENYSLIAATHEQQNAGRHADALTWVRPVTLAASNMHTHVCHRM